MLSSLFNFSATSGGGGGTDDISSDDDATESPPASKRGGCDEEDDDFWEIVWLRSMLDQCRELMVNVNASPRIFDELQHIVAKIGHDEQITELYRLLFDVERWRKAIEPYPQAVESHKMFGWVNYVQRHRLDSLVCHILTEQSLDLAYYSYQTAATNERLAMFTRVVTALQFMKRFSKMDRDRVVALTNLLVADVTNCATNTFHALLHAVLSMIDPTVIRKFGQCYARAMIDGTDELAECLRRTQETVAREAGFATETTTAVAPAATEECEDREEETRPTQRSSSRRRKRFRFVGKTTDSAR